MDDTAQYRSLRDYLRVLRDQWLVIAAITVVCGGVALFVSMRQEPEYEASSAIAFEDETQQLSLLGGSVSPRTATGKTPQARAQTIDEPAVFTRVADALSEPVTAAELQGAIDTSLDEESFLVDVNATWDDADFAAELANVFAREAVEHTNEQVQREYRAALKRVRARVDGLGSSPEDQSQLAALTDQTIRLQFLADNAESAQTVETAEPPDAPTSPRTTRNTAIGLLLGLVIGVFVAFLRDALDRRLRGPGDVHEELGLPLLGHVREDALGKAIRVGASFDKKLQPDIESFRIIRQNLEFLRSVGQPSGRRQGDAHLSDDQPNRTVMVTSPVAEEGKSTVAAGLAFANAADGKNTLLVECDLRRPVLAQRLGLRPAPGLTDYLMGRVEPAEILQPAGGAQAGVPGSFDGQQGDGASADTQVGNPLICITAGSGTPQPAELLGSERFEQFLSEVTEAYDAVVIDSAPLLPVADGLEVLPRVDAVMLCIRSGKTTREQASLARSALERFHGRRPAGIVVTGLTRRDEKGYGYSAYVNQAPPQQMHVG